MTAQPDEDSYETPFWSPQLHLRTILESHGELSRGLQGHDARLTICAVGDLLTVPSLQQNALRLEVLQHFAVGHAGGRVHPTPSEMVSWLNELGQGPVGRLEDPPEDMFVGRVSFERRDYLVFEGLWEGSSFYLQIFLDLLQSAADASANRLKPSVKALLVLSSETAKRAGLNAYDMETPELSGISRLAVEKSTADQSRVFFSHADLRSLNVEIAELAPFVLSGARRSEILDGHLGDSQLDRYPVLLYEDGLCLTVPSAVSPSIRRLLMEEAKTPAAQQALYSAYASALTKRLIRVPLLGQSPTPSIPMRQAGSILMADVASWADHGRFLHLCFIVDDFADYAGTGLARPGRVSGLSTSAIDASIKEAHSRAQSVVSFREGLSLVIQCGWGRPMISAFDGVLDARWRAETISLHDFVVLSWMPEFSPLTLWSLLDAKDMLSQQDVHIINPNGILNLFAWASDHAGHIAPHDDIPDNWAGGRIMLQIEQNGLRRVRKKVAEAYDVHHAVNWQQQSVQLQRIVPDSHFEDDKSVPLYASIDDLEERRLVAAYESATRRWWIGVEGDQVTDQSLHYELWKALAWWLARAAPALERVGDDLTRWPATVIYRFDDIRVEHHRGSPVGTGQDRISASAEAGCCTVVVRQGFLDCFRESTNIGERTLIEAFVTRCLETCLPGSGADKRKQLLDEIFPDEWARHVHFFEAQHFRDFFANESIPDPILISEFDNALSRIGLGHRGGNASGATRILGVEQCCTFLSQLVESTWLLMQSALRTLNREQLLMKLFINLESIAKEATRWSRTARAVLAVHDGDGTTAAATEQVSRLNTASMATRVLIEMATSECPTGMGRTPSTLDVARLLVNAVHLHYLGGSSDAIRHGIKAPEVRVRALGDVHTQVEFDNEIAQPYGDAFGARQYERDASRYERHFANSVSASSVSDNVEPDFGRAWHSTFGFSIDELRTFLDNLENEGIRQHKLVFVASTKEICDLKDPANLSTTVVMNILSALSLRRRSSWATTPEGFMPRDWYPWRFRRRLSLISRPIVEIDNDDYLIAPGTVRAGAVKVLEYCHSGGYDARDFPPGLMRSWIGMAENRRGHAFNDRVSARLMTLGWQTLAHAELSHILNAKMKQDLGDIDVLAWKGRRVLAIECKDLEVAMTLGDIARQLQEFRGVSGGNGKPDRLQRHLSRARVLCENEPAVRRFVRSDGPVSIETVLAFSNLVPMLYSNIAAQLGVRLVTYATLEEL